MQESYVWEKYLQHSVDFFPVGDCFQSQEERALMSGGTTGRGGPSGGAEGGRSHLGGQQKKSNQQKQHSPIKLKKSQTMFM